MKKGFTLIELLVVMAIIATLLTIAVPRYFGSLERSKEAVLKENLYQMRDAISKYYADKGKYPGNLQDLVSEKYIRAIPVDPFTHSADTWREIPSEPDLNNPTSQPGVYDVRSGSDLRAMDGTSYSEWD